MNKSLHTDCPIALVATLLSDAWTMLIIRDLLKAPARFSDLEHSLVGISTRTLTAKIKRLEEAGIVEKKDLHHYRLTTQGKKLEKVIEAMKACGKGFIKQTA